MSIFKKPVFDQSLSNAEEKDKATIDKFSASKLNNNKGTTKNIPHLLKKTIIQIEMLMQHRYKTGLRV
jgi:hypothetical protein